MTYTVIHELDLTKSRYTKSEHLNMFLYALDNNHDKMLILLTLYNIHFKKNHDKIGAVSGLR